VLHPGGATSETKPSLAFVFHLFNIAVRTLKICFNPIACNGTCQLAPITSAAMPLKTLDSPCDTQDPERDDDGVRFSAGSSPDSWAGSLDDDCDMPEEAVREYIKDNAQKLFQKLHGLPVASSDIPPSFHGQRVLKHLEQNGIQPPSHHSRCSSPASLAAKPAATEIYTPGITTQPGLSYAKSTTLKVKKRIEYKLRSKMISFKL